MRLFFPLVDAVTNLPQVDEAADLAIRNEIPLSEELLERLSPAKRECRPCLPPTSPQTTDSLATNDADMPKYRATCEKLGDLAASQGAYAGAAKKYLDAGNQIKV